VYSFLCNLKTTERHLP